MSPENSLLSGALSEQLRHNQEKNKNRQDELEPQMLIARRRPRGPLCAPEQIVTNGKHAAAAADDELRMITLFKSKRQQQQQETVRKVASLTSHSCSRQATNKRASVQSGASLTLIGLLVAATLLLAAAANAEHAQQDGYASGNQPANGGYADQQVAHSQPAHSKAKKIQIVYIKVPLAKLKPSLPVNNGEYASGGSSSLPSATSDNTTNYASQHEATEQTKSQGSQSAADQQQQQQIALDSDSQQQAEHSHQQLSRQQHGTFLIPMAVIQTPAESSGPVLQQQQQQQHGNEQQQALEGPKSMGTASNYHAIHSQPVGGSGDSAQLQSRPVGGGRRSRQQQSPMQHYHQLMMASASVNHGINQGFMSTFLMGEKEKMAAAAMRQVHLMQQQQQNGQVPAVAAATQSAAPLPQNAASANADSLNAQPVRPAAASNNNNNNNNLNTNQQNPAANNYQKQGPGGLMPVMMMPFSMMPDNMIGQAYNAAVGQALPIESGSPASMLSSPSTAHSDTGSADKQQQRANSNSNSNNNNYGGNAGTGGDSSISHGTQSSGSYGSNGQSQQETSSLGNAYQHSASGFAASGPSSGYGSGINSFGASVAFSDYPTGQSTGLGQQMYAQHSSSNNNANTNSNNNNNNINYDSSNNHHHSHSGQQQNGNALSQADSYANQKLRQAKKTIIPIVVQVEHAIMENNGAALATSYNQQNNQQQQQRGNKYSAGGRGHRQLGGAGGKRANRFNGNKQNNEQAYRNPNGLYGAASNEVPLGSLGLGALGSDAQYINAANAQDINKITAAINAENAASAAAALAQADMAFGGGVPAYIPNQRNPQQQQQQGAHRPQSQYASGLQSAASALLANTHPMIQAAASGGLASVSKLGAKLGEMIALPSMQVPGSISSIGSALPSALTSITSQMGVQLNQAVQQVAKEHPTAHAFARQVAQHAGLNLANFNGQPQQQLAGSQQQQLANGNNQQQQQVAASSQHAQQAQLSPQAQLQNLKLSIGQNLQTAAAQLIGAHQKANAQSAASLLSNPLAALYPQSMNAALKQLSGAAGMQMSGSALSPFGVAPNANGADPHHAQSSSIVNVQQQLNNAALMQHQQQHQQQQQSNQLHHNFGQVNAESQPTSSAQSSLLAGLDSSASSGAKPVGKSTFKSKFLSFFQPPKFISNLLSWNDRADERNDQGELSDLKKTTSEEKQAKEKQELAKLSVNKNESVALSELTSTTKAASPVILNATTLSEATSTSLAPALNVTQNLAKKTN